MRTLRTCQMPKATAPTASAAAAVNQLIPHGSGPWQALSTVHE